MHYIPGLSLRASEDAEILGIDDAEMGEFAYDYVGLDQEIGHPLDKFGSTPGGSREPDHNHRTGSVTGTVDSQEKAAAVTQ